jgi:hypothetical protein
MKVEAYKRGIYGDILREPNGRFARFELKDPKHFSDKWMRKIDDDAPVEANPAKIDGSVVRNVAPTSFVELMHAPTEAMLAEKANRESAQSQIREIPKKEKAAKSTGDQSVI